MFYNLTFNQMGLSFVLKLSLSPFSLNAKVLPRAALHTHGRSALLNINAGFAIYQGIPGILHEY